MSGFITWFDRRNFASVRALTLYCALYMTWEAYLWAAGFAYATDKPGVEVAAIIAAVTAPVSALMGYVFKWYVESKANG